MTALTFPTNLYDGTGYLWDILGGGSILNGTYDAYDIGLDHVGFPSAWNARSRMTGARSFSKLPPSTVSAHPQDLRAG